MITLITTTRKYWSEIMTLCIVQIKEQLLFHRAYE
jgi:hypothetical protein